MDSNTVNNTAPTCYKHPDRQTWVSCGRCGKPLCPDCMMHGPVGVRCRECLRGPAVVTHLEKPERLGLAIGVAAAQALVWLGVLIWVGMATYSYSANIFLAGLAGGLVGWSIWRTCGKSYNKVTILTAVALGVGMPLLAGVILWMMAINRMPDDLDPVWVMAVRLLVSVILGAFFAWMTATHKRWERSLFR